MDWVTLKTKTNQWSEYEIDKRGQVRVKHTREYVPQFLSEKLEWICYLSQLEVFNEELIFETMEFVIPYLFLNKRKLNRVFHLPWGQQIRLAHAVNVTEAMMISWNVPRLPIVVNQGIEYKDSNSQNNDLNNLSWQKRPKAIEHNKLWWNTNHGNPQLWYNKHYEVTDVDTGVVQSYWGFASIMYSLFPSVIQSTHFRKIRFTQFQIPLQHLRVGASLDLIDLQGRPFRVSRRLAAVPNLRAEQWREFDRSSTGLSRWVSNEARIKVRNMYGDESVVEMPRDSKRVVFQSDSRNPLKQAFREFFLPLIPEPEIESQIDLPSDEVIKQVRYYQLDLLVIRMFAGDMTTLANTLSNQLQDIPYLNVRRPSTFFILTHQNQNSNDCRFINLKYETKSYAQTRMGLSGFTWYEYLTHLQYKRLRSKVAVYARRISKIINNH